MQQASQARTTRYRRHTFFAVHSIEVEGSESGCLLLEGSSVACYSGIAILPLNNVTETASVISLRSMYRALPSESVRYDEASGTLSLFALLTLRLRLNEVEVQLIKNVEQLPF